MNKKLLSIAEITDLVTDGKHGDCRNEEGSGYFFLSSKELRGGCLIYDNPRQIRKDDFLETHRRTNLAPGDILLTNTGASIGRVGIAQQDERIKFTTFQKSISVIKAKPEIVNNRYLYYFFLANSKYLEELGNGTAQPNLLIGDIKRIRLNVPDMEEQKKIAAILSTYDDLIENNKRRIALLEKMAEEIYREWFVRFRFPGYQNTDFEKGIPKGWKLQTLGNLCLKVTDGSHSSPEFSEGGMYMASVKDMTAYGFEKNAMKTISEQDYGKLVKGDCKPLENDILIAKDGSYLKHVFVWKENYEVVILSSIAILRPNLNKILPYFFSLVLKQPSTKSMMSGFVSGSALPRIILKDFNKMNLLIPNYDLMQRFEKRVISFFNQIRNLLDSNVNLAQTKNMLLPRLISGKLSVENLDIQFPPSMLEENVA